MFSLLKEKLKSFISGLVEREKEKKREEEKAGIKEKSLEKPKPELVVDVANTSDIAERPKPDEEAETEKSVETPKPFVDVALTKRELKPKIGLITQIKSFFSSTITVSESEVNPLLNELELALLESDVSLDATRFLVSDLRTRLVGKEVAKNALSEGIRKEVETALLDLLPEEKMNLIDLIKEKIQATGKAFAPFVILFLGPNGSGKTTTIAKIAALLKEKKVSTVISASDSFRAAAIEQAQHHGDRLGVKVVKHSYGADPTAVAFDAVAHAKANRIDVVLIDTAGRQETNYNLIKEMEKMNRVLKPDLRIFVGEAIAGNALVNQVKEFSEKIGVDALVLTKLDCDAKGGSAFSTAFEIKKPILFVGVGQEYSDLRVFNAKWLVENVLAG